MTWLEYYIKYKADELIGIIDSEISVDKNDKTTIRECSFNVCEECLFFAKNIDGIVVGSTCTKRVAEFLKSEYVPQFSQGDLAFLDAMKYDRLFIERKESKVYFFAKIDGLKKYVLEIYTDYRGIFDGMFKGIIDGMQVEWKREENGI